jgi:antibiotic biosynthesis monooxygenase (ABM) superfamily enzyme
VGCLVLLLAFISPRLALVATWLFTSLLSRAFDSWLVPLLGFFVLPWATLAYAWMYDSGSRVEGLEWFLVGFGALLDLGAYASRRRD